MTIEDVLNRIRDGSMTVEEGLQNLKHLPYEDIGFAKVDTHRALRRGVPEIIFGQGKTPAQVVSIAQAMQRAGQPTMITRAQPGMFEAIQKVFSAAVFHETPRMIFTEPIRVRTQGPWVCVLSAGTADMPVAEEAALTVEALGGRVKRIYDVGVAGIHRLFGHLKDFAQAEALIVVAGMEGALASVVSGLVDVPVVAVPTSIGYGANFAGLAPLLTMLNSCSSGVAVVNIDNGFGAGYFAALLLRSRAGGTASGPAPGMDPAAGERT